MDAELDWELKEFSTKFTYYNDNLDYNETNISDEPFGY